jgi:hypothetical protein
MKSVAWLVGLGALISCCGAARGTGGGAASACAGLEDRDVASAVGRFKAHVESVSPKYEVALEEKGVPAQHLRGAVLEVAPASGLTAPLLTRALRCAASRGSPLLCAIPDCSPLAVAGAEVSVEESGDALAVLIADRDPVRAREIVERSRALARGTSSRE